MTGIGAQSEIPGSDRSCLATTDSRNIRRIQNSDGRRRGPGSRGGAEWRTHSRYPPPGQRLRERLGNDSAFGDVSLRDRRESASWDFAPRASCAPLATRGSGWARKKQARAIGPGSRARSVARSAQSRMRFSRSRARATGRSLRARRSSFGRSIGRSAPTRSRQHLLG
jgi:hypothetical protein